jgi:TonB family protein
MIIAAKSFLFPSVAAHLLAIALVLIVMWSAPTFKTAKPQMIRVRLTQAAVKPMPTVAPAPTPAPSKPTPAPSKPTPPKPKPTPPPPKPTPPPPKPIVKPTTTPKRTVMPTPKQVIERQKQWEEAQKKKQIAKTAATNVTVKIVKRPPPKKVEIAAVTPQVNTAFEEARKRYEDWQKQKDAPATPAATPASAPVGAQTGVVGPQDIAGTESAVIDDFFCNGIRTAIDRVWRQPSRLLGSCEVTFRLTSDGRVSDVRVSKAGPSELNKSALDAVQNAQFPPFPANLNRDYLDVEVPFEILGTE